ncbi:MAG: protein serine/threonine phosphatase 2C family protein [bacterium]|nr:protein serine/threonine phosphatase 2C family protein [bacterium]
MSGQPNSTVKLLIREDLPRPAVGPLGTGRAAVFTARCEGKPTPNEDAVGLVTAGEARCVIVVADGFGGQPAGDQAAELALSSVVESVAESLDADAELQAGILTGFDRANEAVRAMGIGAATTLAAVEIDGDRMRPYHVGDTEVLVVGQRGRIKLQTITHSPVGYGVEAGILDQDEALHHEDRHVVSNMVGSDEMRIEIGPTVSLCPRDTVVVGSDGLFDNLTTDEIVEVIRKGDLGRSSKLLVQRCRERMNGTGDGPCKPDDLTVVVFRLS